MAHQAANYLQKTLGTEVQVADLRFKLLNRVELSGLFLRDQAEDTLLYAGSLEGKITDWFIFKEDITLEYLRLKDARVAMRRLHSDAAWNFQFIIDAFRSDKQPEKEAKNPVNFDLNELILERVHFTKQDDTFGNAMNLQVRSLALLGEDIDLQQRKIVLKSFSADELRFEIVRASTDKPLPPVVIPDLDSKTPFNPNKFEIDLNKLDLRNSVFILTDLDVPVLPDQFDGRHLHITGIDIDVADVQIRADTLFGTMNRLSAKDRSGIEIKKMSGLVRVDPTISEVKELYLETNRSVLRDYFAMKYQQFPDFRDFIHRVHMSAKLRGSHVSMDDIAFFAPTLLRWTGRVYSGSFDGEGPVADLDIKNIDLRDHQLHFTGNYRMTGLPDIETTQITYTNGSIQTSYPALKELFPEINNLDIEQLDAIQSVTFEGNVAGKYTALTIDGTVATNLGTVEARSLFLDYSGQNFLYQGQLVSIDLDVAQLFPNTGTGVSSFNLYIDGDGFDFRKNTIAAKGHIAAFPFRVYTYTDADIDMSLAEGTLAAQINSRDSNAQLALDLKINGLDGVPSYQALGNIFYADFYTLGWINRPLKGSAAIQVDLTGSTGKDVVGEAILDNLLLITAYDTLDYDSLIFRSDRIGLENFVQIETNNIQVSVNGLFYLDELLRSGQRFLANYLSEYIPEPSGYVPHQVFDFSIKAAEPDQIVSLFTPGLSIAQGLEISGSVNGTTQRMQLAGFIPYVKYNNLKAENISISSVGDATNLSVELQAQRFISNEKEMISELDFTTDISNNYATFDINTTGNTTFGTANIHGNAKAQNDSIYIHFNTSELIFNNQKWDIAGGSSVALGVGYLDINNFRITSEKQLLEINTPRRRAATPGHALVYIQHINVRPILAMLGMEDVQLEGEVGGTIEVAELPKAVEADFDLLGQNLSTRNNPLGQIKLIGAYSSIENKLMLDSPSGMYDEQGAILLTGHLHFDTARRNVVDFKAEGKNASLAWAEPFAAELTKDLSGKVNGYINIKGVFPQPNIDGEVHIANGHFTPLITGVDYELPDAYIDISSEVFNIRETEIRDEEGNTGTLSGTIDHRYFADLDFALRVVSDKLKVLDKQVGTDEVETFYGTVYAGVNLTLRGLLRDLTMNITARTAENSKLYIPLTSDADLDSYDYISFKKDLQSIDTNEQNPKKTRLNINLDAIVNNDLVAEIIIDPVAGDKINAVGTGNLAMFIPSEGDIRLNGSYYIESGFYDFTFNSLQLLRYRNRFNLLSGSVINWDGDIADATVDVKANTIKRARLYDLITDDVMRGAVVFDNSGSERSDALTPQNIIIDMNMTGKLLSPELKFRLELEETRSIGTYAYQKLQRINQDDRDLVNQVLSLLVLNQFLPMEGVNSNVAVNTGVSNVAELISTFASSQITNFTNKVLGIEDLWVNLKYKNYNITDEVSSGNLSYLNRNEAGVSLRKNFFNDRLVIDVGGVYDWGMGSMASQSGFTTNLTGDFRVAYLLTPDGQLRLNIFRNSSFDAVSLQNIGRHGVGFTYRKSFNDIFELFGIPRMRREPITPPPSSPPPPPIPYEADSIPSQDSLLSSFD